MSFQWLKRYVPRGLYGRAALILILPVVTLQLVVSVVFVQRHFEGVSSQMSRDLAREVKLVLEQPELAPALDLTLDRVDDSALPERSQRRWFDFSGLVVTQTLERRKVRPLWAMFWFDDGRPSGKGPQGVKQLTSLKGGTSWLRRRCLGGMCPLR